MFWCRGCQPHPTGRRVSFYMEISTHCDRQTAAAPSTINWRFIKTAIQSVSNHETLAFYATRALHWKRSYTFRSTEPHDPIAEYPVRRFGTTDTFRIQNKTALKQPQNFPHSPFAFRHFRLVDDFVDEGESLRRDINAPLSAALGRNRQLFF